MSKLLQYMADSDPDNNDFGALSQQVIYHKKQSEGVGSMCKAVEEYAKEREEKAKLEGRLEGKLETIKNLLKKNISLDVALECAQIDKATYEKYAE